MRFKVTRFAKNTETRISPITTDGRGVGDMVARIAKPIALGIDRVLHTRLQDCGSCEDRRRWLNEVF